MELENVADFKGSLGVDCSAQGLEVEPPGMIFRKGFIFINIQ